MENNYKHIVLLSGLEYMNDYNFRIIKSLLIHDLKLTKKMQDDYDRIKIADLMEVKFPEDAGLSKLIEVCEDIPELADRVDILRKKLEKVQNKTEIKSESSPLPLTSNMMEVWEVEPAMVTASTEESKDSNPELCDTMTTQVLEEEPKFPLFSATSTSQAEHEPLTPQRFPTTASSSLQMPLEPTEVSPSILATTQGSSAPCSSCDKASQVPPGTASSSIQTIQTCLAPSILPCSLQTTLKSPKTEPSRVLAIQTTEAKKASGHNRPQVPAAAVSSSFIKPQVTPARLPSSVQTPWMPQATVPSNAQTFQMNPATMTSGHNSPPVSAATVHSSYSNPQVAPATVPRCGQAFQLTPAAMTGDCNKVSGSRVPVHPHLSAAIVSSSYNNLRVTPATVSSIAQSFRLTPAKMTSGCNSPQMSAATVHSSYSNPQVTPATVPNSGQALRMTPATITNGCSTSQVSVATRSSSHNKSRETPATVPRNAQSLQQTPAAMISGCNSPTRGLVHYSNPQMNPATVFRSDQTLQLTPAAMTSGCKRPQVSAATVSSSYNKPQVTPATVSKSSQSLWIPPVAVPRSAQTVPMTPAAMSNGCNSPKITGARGPVHCNNPQMTPATVSSNIQTLQLNPATMAHGCNSPQVSAATVSSSGNNTPQVSSATVPRSFPAMFLSPATPLKKQRLKSVPKQPCKEDGHQQGSKQVMVLKATEPFTYDMREDKRMFHATVATETEFFRVKVFDIALKEKFIPKKVIVISDYVGYNGFLEIYSTSCVSEVNDSNVMNIPSSLRQRANATPTISSLYTQQAGTFVNGTFTVYAKTVKSDFIYYGIEDKTGKMEVVVYGQFTNMYCEPRDKLKLFCFELSSSLDTWQLRSVRHSYMQVIQARRREYELPNVHAIIETAQSSLSWIPEQW